MKRILIEPNRYFDSVFLMRIGRDLERLPGVDRAIVAMGTPANLDNVRGVGFVLPESTSRIRPDSLLVAIDAESKQVIDAVTARLEELLAGQVESDETSGPKPVSLAEGLKLDPKANLALISVPGEYAAREVRVALRRGLHVMLFSDNIPVEDEVALKDEAIERGLLMMGPDCGTAILNGVPLGFANVCRRGTIGVVGASGTGIQEISSLVHRHGGGISQAIGTGGRDLSGDVGARMTRFGIDALADDSRTEVLVVVSKAPATCVVSSILKRLEAAGKPTIVQFVGFDPEVADPAWLDSSVQFAQTLEEAAILASEAAGLRATAASSQTPATARPATDHTIRGRVMGLFCGGTLCQEAWSLIDRAGIDVVSNVAFDPSKRVRPTDAVSGHALWDLGDDAFTVGKPHPMIEPALRDDRVAEAGSDPNVRIVLVDCVLGHGAHPDPARSLAEASRRASADAEADGRALDIVASVTGTDLDPQNRNEQRRRLQDAGVVVAESNAAAVRVALEFLAGEEGNDR